MPDPDIAVFVGPTGIGGVANSAIHHPRLMLLPPVARGDLGALPNCIQTVLVVDGYFASQPSVGHLELIKTMEHRRVFGCSSLGAIRAFELRNDGMTGLGRVYSAFSEFDDFMDDEVALLHAPAPYYWPLSMPLVNVRFALHELQNEGVCTGEVAEEVIGRLKAAYFGERTLEAVHAAARDAGGEALGEVLTTRLTVLNVKRADFLDALAFLLSDNRGKGGATL